MYTLNLVSFKRLPAVVFSIALAAAALLLLTASASAAGRAAAPSAPALVFTVNSTADVKDDNLGDFHCEAALPGLPCTLRAAVQELDHDLGGTIHLPGGVYTLTDIGDNDLLLRKDIAIIGDGPGLSVIQGKPNWGFRILTVQNGADVILSSLAISGGNASPVELGGGLDVVSGTVLLVDSLVTNNQAGNGGGIANSSQLIVDHSTIRQNGAYTNGGGIYSVSPLSATAFLTMNVDLLSDNVAAFEAGGLYNAGRAVIMTTTISLNEGYLGGGVFNTNPGALSMSGSAILSNQGIGGGGGLLSGGVGSVAKVANTTVSGNLAGSQGGGVGDIGGEVDLYNVTVVSNTGNLAPTTSDPAGGGLYSFLGTFNVSNSLVAHNVDQLGKAPDCWGTFFVVTYNLVQNTKGCGNAFNVGIGDITGTDPLLLPLGFYGGPTLTYGLSLHSPAVDAGDFSGCHFGPALLAIDQRGGPRKLDGNGDGVARCDMGAFELQPTHLFLPLILR